MIDTVTRRIQNLKKKTPINHLTNAVNAKFITLEKQFAVAAGDADDVKKDYGDHLR